MHLLLAVNVIAFSHRRHPCLDLSFSGLIHAVMGFVDTDDSATLTRGRHNNYFNFRTATFLVLTTVLQQPFLFR